MPAPTLITFPPSLDSELSRFLLSHYRIAHEERRHTLYFCFFVTMWRGYSPLFPMLAGESYKLDTVRKIVDHFDPRAPGDRKLLGSGDDRKQIEADWPLFNDTLAFASAVFAYYHLLPHRRIMVQPLSDGTPPFEVSAVRAFYPAFSVLLRLLLRLTASRATSALDQARDVFAGVDQRLADGRRYLVGDRFSLSDMAFAVAAAPLVLPEPYAERLPPLAEMPDVLGRAVSEMRARPAGQFAMRIYRDHRNPLPEASRSDLGGRDELVRSLGG
jgi:glutathione S-transferase